MGMTPKSGLFLGLSCVAAIAAVGSVFELTSGAPDWGTTATAIILALSVPLSGACFYAAVKNSES
ncbi:MAG: hypothetical protein Fur0042_13770 [Cyanophyceae cyanobacterium]|jgi:hypothetical protein